MTMHIAKPHPISMLTARKTDLRAQFGALVYRIHNGKTQILLITSRKTNRWIIPKGWPMCGLTPADAAAQEAWEEAGVKGKTLNIPLGSFSYSKKIRTRGGAMRMPVMTIVYPVEARKLSNSFPEVGQRHRKWFSPKKAAKLVREPDLAQIIRNFDTRRLH